MPSHSQTTLQSAIAAVNQAFAKLDAAAEVAAYDRSQSAASREAVQAELSASWQQHSDQLQAALAEATSEMDFLRDDNARLANQLHNVQQQYVALQKVAGAAAGKLDSSIKQLDLVLGV
jgi:small-conductance mechanosensitive channel